MVNCIEVKDLSFSYRKKERSLLNISLSVEENQIFGFLGHNGSGKSTLLKLISGLMKPDNGSIEFFAKPIQVYSPTELYGILGMLIEKPVFYGHLTLFENLRIIAHYRRLNKNRIHEALEMVAMRDFAGIKTNQLSTGMKQRMGIATALIHDPNLILLDEPANGLDPEGIIEIRDLLKSLKSMGKTLLVSSHVLSEMEKICDHLVILKNGRSVYSGSLDDLIRNRNNKGIMINASPESMVIDVLSRKKIPFEKASENIYVDIEHAQVPDLLNELQKHDTRIDQLNFRVKTLEDLYMSLK